jgi:hypothetical protein
VFAIRVPLDAGAGIDVNFGPYYAGEGRTGFCQSVVGCDGTFLLPVTLGVPLAVGLHAGVVSPIAYLTAITFRIDMSVNLSVTFLELDQRSQVGWTDITTAPEPRDVWLSAFGIVFIAIRRFVIARKA